MCTARGNLSDRRNKGIDHGIGTQLSCVLKLACVDINRAHM